MEGVMLNHIIVRPVDSSFTGTALSLPLFRVETLNTAEIRTQSETTIQGNQHVLEKFSDVSLVGSQFPSGLIELGALDTEDEKMSSRYVAITYL